MSVANKSYTNKLNTLKQILDVLIFIETVSFNKHNLS